MPAALLLAAALAAASPDCAALQRSARPTIEHANSDWLRAMRAGDAQSIAATYAEDGVFVLPDGTVAKGREAVRALYAGAPGKGEIVGGGIESLGLACGGPDIVYEWGRGTVRTRGADGREQARTSAYLTVWKRAGEAWLIARNMAF